MTVPALILAALTLAGACSAMVFRGLVHSALALAVAFAGLGALYLNLGAQFLGLAQLLVYVGAIAVLIVFVILLAGGADSDGADTGIAAPSASPLPIAGVLIAAAIFAIAAWTILHSAAIVPVQGPAPQASVRQLGEALMGGYIFPLELIGLMLTAALIGAVIVAMKGEHGAQ